MYSLYSAGRDEKLFPDPLKFDPERWNRDETHSFAIQPFGFGPRGCYGKVHACILLNLFKFEHNVFLLDHGLLCHDLLPMRTPKCGHP